MPHADYTVGWICALPIEMAAASAMLDERHNPLQQNSRDHNAYILGRTGNHNVVLACLPTGVPGKSSATSVADKMLLTFEGIRFGLMVGVGGGVPSKENDIRLGDIVVSKPTGKYGGVIQYDFGKTMQEGRFKKTGSLNRPPDVLLTALANLQSKHMMEGHELAKYISKMLTKYPKMIDQFARPNMQQDSLYDAEYDHKIGHPTCLQCDTSRLMHREPRTSEDPFIHYGLIASGDQVMRHGATREQLRRELDVLCFEMEAAGLMDRFPCLVIRGICDYADSHKNKQWQGYAAAAAAAYAKELLSIVPGNLVVSTCTAIETTKTSYQGSEFEDIIKGPKNLVSQIDDQTRDLVELVSSQDLNESANHKTLSLKQQDRKKQGGSQILEGTTVRIPSPVSPSIPIPTTQEALPSPEYPTTEVSARCSTINVPTLKSNTLANQHPPKRSPVPNTTSSSPDGRILASASAEVRLWNSGTGAARGTLKGHSKGVRVVAFSPDSKVLAAPDEYLQKLLHPTAQAVFSSPHKQCSSQRPQDTQTDIPNNPHATDTVTPPQSNKPVTPASKDSTDGPHDPAMAASLAMPGGQSDSAKAVLKMHGDALDYERKRKHTKARKLYEEALKISRSSLGEADPVTLSALYALASFFERQGNFAEAVNFYEKALEICVRSHGESDKETLSALYTMALFFEHQGSFRDATRFYEKALGICAKNYGESHAKTLSALHAIASFFERRGKYGEAKKFNDMVARVSNNIPG